MAKKTGKRKSLKKTDKETKTTLEKTETPKGAAISLSQESQDKAKAKQKADDKKAKELEDKAKAEAEEAKKDLENAEPQQEPEAEPEAEKDDAKKAEKKKTLQKKGQKLDRIAGRKGNKNQKFGLVFSSRAGSFKMGKQRFSKETHGEGNPYTPRTEKEFLELLATGHFTKVAV